MRSAGAVIARDHTTCKSGSDPNLQIGSAGGDLALPDDDEIAVHVDQFDITAVQPQAGTHLPFEHLLEREGAVVSCRRQTEAMLDEHVRRRDRF